MTNEERINILIEALKKSKREHRYCEDGWYSCPKAEDGCSNPAEGKECNCGADKWNNYVDEILEEVK